jgi:hypothetical protein
MRQRNTVDHLEYHNQFQVIRGAKKDGKGEVPKGDKKQGQSEYRVKKRTGK